MLTGMLKRRLGSLRQFLYPAGCLLCSGCTLSSKQRYLCAGCLADLQQNKHACVRCALPMNRHSPAQMCADCLKSPPKFETAFSAFVYAQPLEWIIQQLKFNQKLYCAPLLSSLMLDYLYRQASSASAADVIIPMPLHTRRLKERGFNQSQLLLEPIAAAMGMRIDNTSCRRVRDTAHQTGKTAKQRRSNIKGAFQFDNQQCYKHVIVFDDVITTGSTVNEIARVLKHSGVEKVEVWSLARADK